MLNMFGETDFYAFQERSMEKKNSLKTKAIQKVNT